MATTLEILLIDTVRVSQALGEDYFDEARFGCESNIKCVWGEQISMVGNAAMNLEAFLRQSAISLQAGRDKALAELVSQVEAAASPLRGQLPSE